MSEKERRILSELFFPGLTGDDFQETEVRYCKAFPDSQESPERLLERVRQGKEIVVIVTFNIVGRIAGLEVILVPQAQVLLGKRTAREVGENWGVGTWAPVMGRISKEDVRMASRKAEIRRTTGGRDYTFGDLIADVGSRERIEEVKRIPAQTTIVLAEPFYQPSTDRVIHVVGEVVQAVSQGEREDGDFLFPLLLGKTALMTSTFPASLEHAVFGWFMMADLPPKMEQGSKRAILSAALALVAEGYLKLEDDR